MSLRLAAVGPIHLITRHMTQSSQDCSSVARLRRFRNSHTRERATLLGKFNPPKFYIDRMFSSIRTLYTPGRNARRCPRKRNIAIGPANRQKSCAVLVLSTRPPGAGRKMWKLKTEWKLHLCTRASHCPLADQSVGEAEALQMQPTSLPASRTMQSSCCCRRRRWTTTTMTQRQSAAVLRSI